MLFDGAHLQLIHQPGPNGPTLITFDIMHARANGQNAFARKLALRLGLNLLAFVPHHPCWYPASEMARAAAICRAHVTGAAIAYGASMGGYGALRWGKAAGASHVLACSPQISIDPAMTEPRDRRYHRHFDAALHRDMRCLADHLPGTAAVLYDPLFAPDAFQAGLAKGMAGLHLMPLPHMGHATAECVAGSENAGMVFADLLAGRMGALQTRLLGQRKLRPVWRIRLALAAIDRGRAEVARRLIDTAIAEDPLASTMALARLETRLGRTERAVAHYDAALALRPGHKIAQMHRARLAG